MQPRRPHPSPPTPLRPAPQAPLLQLESSLLRRLRAAGRTPPRALRWAITQAVLLACAHHFFFPPLEVRTHTAQRVANAIADNVQVVADALGLGGAPRLA
jgi:hypothetical protein